MKITRTYQRRNGEPFTVEVMIDPDKIADAMAHRMARQGVSRATASNGGITAEVRESASV
jgi:hypothetical protein